MSEPSPSLQFTSTGNKSIYSSSISTLFSPYFLPTDGVLIFPVWPHLSPLQTTVIVCCTVVYIGRRMSAYVHILPRESAHHTDKVCHLVLWAYELAWSIQTLLFLFTAARVQDQNAGDPCWATETAPSLEEGQSPASLVCSGGLVSLRVEQELLLKKTLVMDDLWKINDELGF